MKEIKIKIPDNLTGTEEVAFISKKLNQRTLSGSGKNKQVKRLGDEILVKDIETVIRIERVSTDKPITILHCNVCGTDYQSDMSKYYFHNYGGSRKRNSVCSDDCVKYMVDNFGVRVAKSARKLPAPINYFRNETR